MLNQREISIMILAIAGEKGGTGKTTLATNLCQIRKSEGHDVLLVDSDLQVSSSVWIGLRDEDESLESIPCIQKTGNTLRKQIRDLANRYEDIIIDTGGRDSVEMRGAIAAADVVYIPIRASQFDISTLLTMQELVEQIKAYNDELKVFVCINQASTNVRVSEHTEAQKIIKDEALSELTLSNVVIHDRIAFRTAAKKGMGVVELGSSKAAEEIIKLYKEIYHGYAA